MYITGLQQQSKGKVQVFLDGEPALILTAAQIREADIREDVLYEGEKEAALLSFFRRTAAKSAMELLLRRDYSEKDLHRKLQTKGYSDFLADWAVDYVKSYHYLDDLRVAVHFLEVRNGTMSRQAARQKLMLKGINEDVIEEAFAGICWDEEAGLRQELEKKLRSFKGELTESDLIKVMRSLQNKGYHYGMIRRMLEEEKA